MSVAGSGGLGSPETRPTQCVKHHTQSDREGCRDVNMCKHVCRHESRYERIHAVPLAIVLFVLSKLKGLITRVGLTVSFNWPSLKLLLLNNTG